ncbi:MAG: VWA domain-containing protein [Clostridia bacterium]|nr:VWA domain-containing protein [Clostridia bacterium]
MYTSSSTFKIIASSENEDLEQVIKQYGRSNNLDISIDYAGTLEIMDKLNSGEKYDAVWTSNSIWLYMLNSNVSVKNSKSTSINPVVFGITKSKANELGFIGTEVYTKDIVNAIESGKLKFNMPAVTQTNTGATAYLGFLTALAGNPEILREEDLEKEDLKQSLISLFSGVQRSSGTEEFLEELFLTGKYDAVVTYEASIININKKLESQGKEPLYIIYAKDGVSISDSPFAYIDNKDKRKLEVFEEIQSYLLSNEGQTKLGETGRRVWYGGVNENADKTLFNPEWGIDTTQYLTTTKYPSTAVIRKALGLYQTKLRKPIHAVFCLDYSGSMYGTGLNQLRNAMHYILDEEEAGKDLLQFSEKDKITVIPFNDKNIAIWHTDNGTDTKELLDKIDNLQTEGATNIYDCSIEALDILNKEDQDKYSLSVIIMTDGQANYGYFRELRGKYNQVNKDIPIFGILFGSADASQLKDIADLTNAKVFDGRTSLLTAFKMVRGFN